MLAAISEFERELIRERQREGIAIAKANGKYKGRKPKLDANQVEAMKKRIADGESKASVAKSLGITRTTLYEYLKWTPNHLNVLLIPIDTIQPIEDSLIEPVFTFQ